MSASSLLELSSSCHKASADHKRADRFRRVHWLGSLRKQRFAIGPSGELATAAQA